MAVNSDLARALVNVGLEMTTARSSRHRFPATDFEIWFVLIAAVQQAT